MLDTTHENQKDIALFVDSMNKKTKRFMKYNHKNAIKQAIHISPAYRDFVNKLLNNSALKVSPYVGGSCRVIEHGTPGKMSKRCKVQICVAFDEMGVFPHELGHATDFLFGDNCSLTSSVIIQDGKTLEDIFNEEFNEKAMELFETILDEYMDCINANINEDAYEVFLNYMPKYNLLQKTKNPKKRRELQKELYDSGFVEIYYQVVTKKCFKIIEQKYTPITDALSARFDISGLLFRGHSFIYYALRPSLLVQEFFANVFADKISANHTRFDALIKLMPKSFNAFERLFVILYDHIQNNKRFTDLPLKVTQKDKKEAADA